MSSNLAPFGLRPSYHPSGAIRSTAYKLVDATQAAYGTALYKGLPVTLVTDGSLARAAEGADWLGVLDCFEYTDANGVPRKAPYLPASSTGITDVVAFVYDDPAMIFEVQCSATVANTALGDQLTTFSNTSGYTEADGNTYTGQSKMAMSGVLGGAGVQGLMTVVGISKTTDNAWGDAYPILKVRNARHQFNAVKVAI
jgi:hypothetical protein